MLNLKSICFSLIFIIKTSPVFAEDLVIPVLVGQTGASMSFGKSETDGYTLAVEEWNSKGGVNGKKVSIQVEDTQTNQQQIITAFHRLTLNNPAVVLGPTWLDTYQGVIPIAQKKNVLLVSPSAAREAFSPEYSIWPVSFYFNSTLEAKALVKGLNDRGYKKLALVYQEEPFSEMIRKLILQNTPLESDIGVQQDTTSFQTVITKIKSKKPDALIILVWDEQSLLSLLQQIKVQMPEMPLATIHDGEGWLTKDSFKKTLPRLIFSKFVISGEDFIRNFKKRFGYEPILTASTAYDAINIVLSAYSAKRSKAEEIRDYIVSNEHTTASFGNMRFASDGSTPGNFKIVDSSDKDSLN